MCDMGMNIGPELREMIEKSGIEEKDTINQDDLLKFFEDNWDEFEDYLLPNVKN